MPIGSVSRSRVAFIPEVTPNTIPATPTFLTLRRTSGSLATNKNTVQSEEIQADRNVRDVYQTMQSVEGSYECEFSHASLDDMLSGAMMANWATNVLSNGVTQRTFTFEEMVDLGGSQLFHRYTAAMVNQLQLSAEANQAVRATLGIMARQEAVASAIISGATYTAPNTEPIETGVTVNITTLAGLTPIPICRGLRLNINNNLRMHERLGSLFSDEFGMGQAEISGEIDLYYDTLAQYQLSLNHSSGQITATLGSQANKKYTFNMPNVRFLQAAKPLRGRNDSVMATLPFQALGTGSTASLSITRLVA